MEERFKIAICVDLMISRDLGQGKEILLMKRKNTGFNDGEYELPGGHLEANEDLFEAMIREAKEELMLNINRKSLKIATLMHHYTGNRLNVIFKLDGKNLNPQIGEPNKCESLDWFNIQQLPNNITSKMRAIINNVAAGTLYERM